MPKRSYEEKMERYNFKIRRLEEKQNKKRQRIIYSSDSSEENSDNELLPANADPTMLSQDNNIQEDPERAILDNPEELNVTPDLDPDVLLALGDPIEVIPKFGEKIHGKLALLWLPVLRKGLEKEVKEKLLKQFQIPENCSLLQAPKLNPEIAAATTDIARGRDKKIEAFQQQLGLGITALNRGLSLLLENDTERVKAIKLLSDSSRILCDLHHVETEVRKNYVKPVLDKSFLNLIQEEERDDTLFGQKLSEKIKASKAIEKQSLQIKKSAPVKPTPATSSTQAGTSRPRFQGNWSGPPRYTTSRGGRGGFRKPVPASRRVPQASAPKQSTQPQSQTKPRAPAQQ